MPISDLYGRVVVDTVPPYSKNCSMPGYQTTCERGVNVKPSIVNRIKSNWTLKRLGKSGNDSGFLTLLWLPFFFWAMLGNGGSSRGLRDDNGQWANEYSRYPLGKLNVWFLCDNSWAGFRGTGRTGFETGVCCAMPLPILFGNGLQRFNATGYLVQGSLFLRLHFRQQTPLKRTCRPSWCECKRIFNRGFLCWTLTLDFGSWGLCCLWWITDKEKTTKAIHATMNLCLGVYPIGFLYCLRSWLLLKINDFSSDISNASYITWHEDCHAPFR